MQFPFLLIVLFFACGLGVGVAPTTTRTSSSPTTTPSATSFCGQFNKSANLLAGSVLLCWTVDAATSTIAMGLEVQGSGWVAFGVTNQNGGGMTNADITFCSLTAGCTDRWSSQRATPAIDSVQNIAAASVSRPSPGVTRASWTRSLSTGDTAQDRDISLAQQMEIMVAYQASSDSDAFKHTAKTIAYVNFGSGAVPSPGGSTVSTVQINPLDYDNSITVLLGQCGIYWKIIQSNAIINIGVTCFNTGYIGVGITNQLGKGMNASDIWIGAVSGGVMAVRDYWTDIESVPNPDNTTQDLTAVSGSRVSGKTTMMFSRKLDTGDVRDRAIVNGTMEMIIAFSYSDSLIYHGLNDREIFYVNFFSGVGGQQPPPVAPIDPTWIPINYPARLDVFPGQLELYWRINEANNTINFAIRCTLGWVGFGISGDGTMVGADMVLGYFDAANNPVLQDSYSPGTSTPVNDVSRGGTFDLTEVSGSRNASGMTLKWTRSIFAADTNDRAIPTGPVTVVLAFGPDSIPLYHGSQRVAVAVDLRSGVAAATAVAGTLPMKVVHGALMATAFGITMMLAVAFATIPKSHKWWFPAHWVLNAVSACLILAAFVIALVFQNGNHFSTTTSVTRGAHSILGMIVISFVCCQVVLGVAINALWQRQYKAGSGAVPEKTLGDIAHHFFGRAILLLAVITLFLGLVEIQSPWFFYLIFGLVLVAWVAVFVCLLYLRRKSSLGQHAAITMGDL